MDKKPCTVCGGEGKIAERNNEKCKRCEGTGNEPSPPMNEG